MDLNKNNIKTLKSLRKLLNNPVVDALWPHEVKMHKEAITNALTNIIPVGEAVLCQGGLNAVMDGFQASQKADLFAEVPEVESTKNLFTKSH
jgi:hypothetical protein